MIICSSLLFVGCLVKSLSVNLADFRVAFLGQILVALAQVIILNIPTQLAFEWFATNEKTLSKLMIKRNLIPGTPSLNPFSFSLQFKYLRNAVGIVGGIRIHSLVSATPRDTLGNSR